MWARSEAPAELYILHIMLYYGAQTRNLEQCKNMNSVLIVLVFLDPLHCIASDNLRAASNKEWEESELGQIIQLTLTIIKVRD